MAWMGVANRVFLNIATVLAETIAQEDGVHAKIKK
jgi:hypothetical protein